MLLAICAALLLAQPAAAQDTCMTDQDVKSEVAMGYLIGQSGKAFLCDQLLSEGDPEGKGRILALNREVIGRFGDKWRVYGEWREELFRRRHGAEWQQAMAADQRMKTEAIMSLIDADPQDCREFVDKLQGRLEGEWGEIKALLDSAFERTRPSIPPCQG